MTTYDLTGLNGGLTGLSSRDKGRAALFIDTIVDFSAASTSQPNNGFPNYTANATTLSGNASGDTVKIWSIPAVAGTATSYPYNYNSSLSATFGTVAKVNYAGIEVLVADTAGNSGTLAVGDSGSTTRWYNATTVATTGFKTPSTNTAVFYTSANYIALSIGTGAINAVVRVYASIEDLSAIKFNLWF